MSIKRSELLPQRLGLLVDDIVDEDQSIVDEMGCEQVRMSPTSTYSILGLYVGERRQVDGRV